MRLVEVTTVQMQRVSQTEIGVSESKLTLNLDAVCGFTPATVPSEVKGPDGAPVGTPACNVFLPGGSFLVRKTYAEMKDLMSGKSAIEVGF